MQQFLQNLLVAVVTAAVPVLLTFFIAYITTKRNEKLTGIKNEHVRQIIFDATNIVIDAVKMVAQVYVEDLKKAGSFTKEKQVEALNRALTNAKELMNDETKKLLAEKYNDIDKWIETIVESYISSTKKN